MTKRESYQYQPVREAIAQIASRSHNNPEAVLEVLKKVQALDGYISPDSIQDVSVSLGIPAERAYGVATFYTMLQTSPPKGASLRICDGPVCWLKDSTKLLEAAKLALHGWNVERNSCLGLCDRAPAVLLDGKQGCLTAEQLNLLNGPASAYEREIALGTNPDYRAAQPVETRVMLADIQHIDPWSLESALQYGAYQGLKRVLGQVPEESLSHNQVIEEVKAADLRGRGGAGFPVGVKWGFVASEKRTPKYIICNADEAEPLVFKDRVLIESKPHQLLEGMAIAAYAVGAKEGFIYIRGEYEKQATLLEHAIKEAEEHGYLGENIRGSGLSFHIHVHRGAGAYICGEETALLESLEGKRGEPRIRPPYPTASGYHNMPTVINNVETFAAVPAVIRNGSDWYASLSTSVSHGTKIFTITGHVNRPGAYESVYGITLRDLIDEFGGGMHPGGKFHFALCGGAAGTFAPEDLLDIPLDYECSKKGLSLGAGSFLICDQSVSPVAILRELLHFFEVESCGKCTPCRVGTRQARETLDAILAGERTSHNLTKLKELSAVMGNASFCGLGQFTALPTNSAIKYFEKYFIEL